MNDDRTRQRRSQWVLALVLVLLAATIGYQVMGGSATTGMLPDSQEARRDHLEGGAAPPDVNLDTLALEEVGEPTPGRNPFRFGARVAAPSEAPRNTTPAESPLATPPVSVARQSSEAPIPLKFIGRVEAPGVGVIAALSDGTFVFYGQEGDVIDGRYRIVTIGVESIVMEYVEGRGRQTLRLTG